MTQYLVSRSRASRRIPALLLTGAALGFSALATSAETVTLDFSDLELAPDTAYTGELGVNGFHSQGFHFNNTVTDWGGGFTSWAGWAYSSRADVSTPGFTSDTAAITGGGFAPETGTAEDAIYAVAFGSNPGQAVITLPPYQSGTPLTVRITNTTYNYFSMLEGDDFAKKFGGEDGEDPDFFTLTIIGLNSIGETTGEVEVSLADFRGEENYIVNEWLETDLTALGNQVASLTFALESSDVGDFGMNTPAYFALDALSIELRTDIISHAYHAEGSLWKHAWLGWYVDAHAPWVFHSLLGWVYWEAGSAGNWFYASELQDWLWSSHEVFPAVWRMSDQDWALISSESTPGSIIFEEAPPLG